MRNRASLLLMELLVMVLVFALAAALCLGVFAKAGVLSKAVSRQDRAVVLAQNVAEAWKAGKIPVATLPEEGLTFAIRPLEPAAPGLEEAEITVYHEENLLFSLHVGRQEVSP